MVPTFFRYLVVEKEGNWSTYKPSAEVLGDKRHFLIKRLSTVNYIELKIVDPNTLRNFKTYSIAVDDLTKTIATVQPSSGRSNLAGRSLYHITETQV